jgi:hypothetical protein
VGGFKEKCKTAINRSRRIKKRVGVVGSAEHELLPEENLVQDWSELKKMILNVREMMSGKNKNHQVER